MQNFRAWLSIIEISVTRERNGFRSRDRIFTYPVVGLFDCVAVCFLGVPDFEC